MASELFGQLFLGLEVLLEQVGPEASGRANWSTATWTAAPELYVE